MSKDYEKARLDAKKHYEDKIEQLKSENRNLKIKLEELNKILEETNKQLDYLNAQLSSIPDSVKAMSKILSQISPQYL